MTDNERMQLIVSAAENILAKYENLNKRDEATSHYPIKIAVAMSTTTLVFLTGNRNFECIDYLIPSGLVELKRVYIGSKSFMPSNWTRPPNLHVYSGANVLIKVGKNWLYLVKDDELPLGKAVVRAWDGVAHKWLPV